MAQDAFVKLVLTGPLGYEEARTNMLKQQIRAWDVLDNKILKLFYTIPREDFVPPEYKSLAFADIFIPLGHGQSMMTPSHEARIVQELQIKSDEKVLLLGIDSGFLLTILSKLANHVYYLDNDLDSFEKVKNKLARFKVNNVTPLIGSVNHGWQDFYPFNIIILTGSLPTLPDFLKDALTIGGRLFSVLGQAPVMEAMIISRIAQNAWNEAKVYETCRPRMLDVKEPSSFEF